MVDDGQGNEILDYINVLSFLNSKEGWFEHSWRMDYLAGHKVSIRLSVHQGGACGSAVSGQVVYVDDISFTSSGQSTL